MKIPLTAFEPNPQNQLTSSLTHQLRILLNTLKTRFNHPENTFPDREPLPSSPVSRLMIIHRVRAQIEGMKTSSSLHGRDDPHGQQNSAGGERVE